MAGPRPGTYGFYQNVRPSQKSDIVGEALKGFQVGDASRRANEALAADKEKAKAKAVKDSIIDPIEIDGMANFGGEMASATANLVSQAGSIGAKARDQYELYMNTKGEQGIPESQYVQIMTNLQANAESWTELANLRKEDYQSLKELDEYEYEDGAIEAERIRQRKSWENIANVSYNDRGILVFNVTEEEQLPDDINGPPAQITKQKSIGEFYALTEPKDLSKARKNVYKAVEESANAEQYLWDWSGANGKPVWNYNPMSSNEAELAKSKEIEQLAIIGDESLIGDRLVNSEISYLSRMLAAENPNMSAERVAELATDMHRTKLMDIHAGKEKAKYTEALKDWEEDQAENAKEADKSGTYYPKVTIEDKLPYTVQTAGDVPINEGAEYVTIDYSKIKGGLQTEQFGGMTVKDKDGMPEVEDGQFINDGKFMTKRGVARGFIVIPGKTEGEEDRYYIEMGAMDDKDLSAFINKGGTITDDMLEQFFRDRKIIEVTEKEIRDQSKRFPNLYNVLIGGETKASGTGDLDDIE